MEVKWTNVFAFGLVLAAIVLISHSHHELGAALAGLGQIGPGYTSEEKFHGFFVLGILAVAAVAIVRLLVEANRRN